MNNKKENKAKEEVYLTEINLEEFLGIPKEELQKLYQNKQNTNEKDENNP